DTRTGSPIQGARVFVTGTDLSTITDASGAYALPEPPAGAAVVVAAASGYAAQSGDVVVEPGASLEVNLSMLPPPTAATPDEEITAGRWELIQAAEAEELLGQPLAVIPGMWVESVAKSAGSRPRIRVAQLSESGERVALVETRSAAARADRPRLTALRVMPPSEAYPVTTATGSFGGLLVTATSTMDPNALRSLLTRLIQAPR
ncbi:MAG TPA: carboxypeptidase regulatory-like domain-containing protein, partial [Gemmatimonadales bacterium]|nr:carboxypeptidase regulatory-like domain-containing protein [Gemmatimonadales bacterium]